MLHEDPFSPPPEDPERLPVPAGKVRVPEQADEPCGSPLAALSRPLMEGDRPKKVRRRTFSRRHAAWFWLTLFCFFQRGGDLPAAVFTHPAVRLHEFPVSGSSSVELLEQLRTKGPKDDDGIVREGLTRWRIRWRPRGGGTALGDRPAQTGIGFSVQVWLPRWRVDPGSPLRLQEQWLAYINAVRVHEARHVTNALQILSRLQKAVANVDFRSPAEQHKADRIAALLLSKLRALDADFDRLSGHGCSAGACAREALGEKGEALGEKGEALAEK